MSGEGIGGVGFVICSFGFGIIATGGCHLLDPTVLMTEFWDIWASIRYDCRILQLDQLIIEGNSATVIYWIQEAIRSTPFDYS